MEQEKRGIYVNTQKTKISFAAAWLVAYLAGLKISGILSGIIGIQNLGQAIFRACFVIVMILYLKKRETLEFYGVRSLKNLDGRGTFYFIPFVLLVVVPFCFGIQNSEPLGQIVLIAFNVLCVGFIEEMIMRVFLFKALMKWGAGIAIAISSSVFGLVHIVNLFGGADVFYTLLQIIFACAIGFVFAVFFYKTENIIPCILCHGLLDVGNIFWKEDVQTVSMIFGLLILISVFYGVYLLKTKRKLLK